MAIDNSPIRFDHSAHDNFIRYYEERSLTDADIGRFRTVRDIVTKYAEYKKLKQPLAVADIGCGAGTSSRIWAEAGHRVVGIDINEQLIEIGRTRVAAAGEAVELRVGSATELR